MLRNILDLYTLQLNYDHSKVLACTVLDKGTSRTHCIALFLIKLEPFSFLVIIFTIMPYRKVLIFRSAWAKMKHFQDVDLQVNFSHHIHRTSE